MKKDRVFDILVLTGETWQDTEERVQKAKQYCRSKDEVFVIKMDHSKLTEFQLNHVRNGVFPFSTQVKHLADRIEFIDADGSVRFLKDRYSSE